MQDVQSFLAGAARIDPFPRPIWRGVINNEDMSAWHVRPDLREDLWKRLHLVVRRDNDQGVVPLGRRDEALRNGHESHFAELSGVTHAWRARRHALPDR